MDASEVYDSLMSRGYATLPQWLNPAECCQLVCDYDKDEMYRSIVTMERCGFGKGEYKYYDYPMPEIIASFRREMYELLRPVAIAWNTILMDDIDFPVRYEDYLRRCEAVCQNLPTPLILKYGLGDYNCLHQDLYGQIVFPFQVITLLSDPAEFAGGNLILTKSPPRRQARPIIVPQAMGVPVVIPVKSSPVLIGSRYTAAAMRHGVSEVTAGTRYTIGVVLHDAK